MDNHNLFKKTEGHIPMLKLITNKSMKIQSPETCLHNSTPQTYDHLMKLSLAIDVLHAPKIVGLFSTRIHDQIRFFCWWV